MRSRHQRKETGGYFRLTLFVNLCCFLDICTHAANPGKRNTKYQRLSSSEHSFCIYKNRSLKMQLLPVHKEPCLCTLLRSSNASLEKEPVIFLWFLSDSFWSESDILCFQEEHLITVSSFLSTSKLSRMHVETSIPLFDDSETCLSQWLSCVSWSATSCILLMTKSHLRILFILFLAKCLFLTWLVIESRLCWEQENFSHSSLVLLSSVF